MKTVQCRNNQHNYLLSKHNFGHARKSFQPTLGKKKTEKKEHIFFRVKFPWSFETFLSSEKGKYFCY